VIDLSKYQALVLDEVARCGGYGCSDSLLVSVFGVRPTATLRSLKGCGLIELKFRGRSIRWVAAKFYRTRYFVEPVQGALV